MPNNNDWNQTRAQQPLYGNYGYYPETNYPYSPYGNYRVTANYQTQPPLPQEPSLSGRWINDGEDIAPREVPMDGSVALFPSKDGSRIIAKSWDANGAIRTIEYVRANSAQTANAPKTDLDILCNKVMERFDKLDEAIASRSARTAKKEV